MMSVRLLCMRRVLHEWNSTARADGEWRADVERVRARSRMFGDETEQAACRIRDTPGSERA
jgi:hypothetical protein